MIEYDYIPKETPDTKFVQACKSGDIEFIKEFYEKSKPTLFKKFLYIFTPQEENKIIINHDSHEYKGFIQACINGHENVINFILENANQLGRDCIMEGFFKGLSHGRLNAVRSLAPLLNKEEILFNYYSIRTFNDLCKNGDLNSIKYLLTDKTINVSLDKVFNEAPDNLSSPNEGFASACRIGDLELVRYLTSSPDLPIHADVNKVDFTIMVRNPEIIRYFILDLKVKQTDEIIKKIYFDDPIFIDNLFQKRDYYEELSNTLSTPIEQTTSNKRKPKI